MYDTDIFPTPRDVYGGFEIIQKQIGGSDCVRGGLSSENLLSGQKNVPRGESKWLKVAYSFNGMLTFYVSVSIITRTFTEPPTPVNAFVVQTRRSQLCYEEKHPSKLTQCRVRTRYPISSGELVITNS
jgi:hypothetical protein